MRILNGYGLAEILRELPCVASIALEGFDPAPLANVTAARLQLAMTATAAIDPGLEPIRKALSAAGYTLLPPDALPVAGATGVTGATRATEKGSTGWCPVAQN